MRAVASTGPSPCGVEMGDRGRALQDAERAAALPQRVLQSDVPTQRDALRGIGLAVPRQPQADVLGPGSDGDAQHLVMVPAAAVDAQNGAGAICTLRVVRRGLQ